MGECKNVENCFPGKLIPWNRIFVPVIQLNVVHICSTDVAPAILPKGTSHFFIVTKILFTQTIKRYTCIFCKPRLLCLYLMLVGVKVRSLWLHLLKRSNDIFLFDVHLRIHVQLINLIYTSLRCVELLPS